MTNEKFVVGSDGPLCPIPQSKVLNSLTNKTLIKSRKGEDIFTATSTSQLFKQLGIKCRQVITWINAKLKRQSSRPHRLRTQGKNAS